MLSSITISPPDEADNAHPVVIIKDKETVPDELVQDDLESKKNNVNKALEQNNVLLEQNDMEPEQEALVPEQTDNKEDDRAGNNDVTQEATQETTTPTIGVVVIACNRPSVGRALDLLLK